MNSPRKLAPTGTITALPSGLSTFVFRAGYTGGHADRVTVRALSWFAARADAARILGVPVERLTLLSVNGEKR